METVTVKKRNWVQTAWGKVKKHPFWTVALITLIVAIFYFAWGFYLVSVKGYAWADWTGFGNYTGSLLKDNRGKTFWDWLQLLVVPIVLAVGALLFNRSERESDRKIADERTTADREIAQDRQNEALLQAYLDKMTDLLLDENQPLRTSEKDSEVRAVARARTLATLKALDGERKGLLLQFLYEANLVTNQFEILDLSGADLYRANLSEASLTNANLSEAILSRSSLYLAKLSGVNLSGATLIGADLESADLNSADMSGATLIGADLSEAVMIFAELGYANLGGAELSKAHLNNAKMMGANLTGANLTQADLTNAIIKEEQLMVAKSLEGATMPDGSKHP